LTRILNPRFALVGRALRQEESDTMTATINNKAEATVEKYNNWRISKRDIEICSIRRVLLPRIVNNIYIGPGKVTPGFVETARV
jgi:hypothetical protein